MKKWIITIVVATALAALGFYARTWLPKVLPFLSNHENADTLKSISSLVQITLWIATALAFMVNLWRPKKKAADPPTLPAMSVTNQSGGVNVAGGETRVYGDLIGRDKTEGDDVAGDKITGNKYVQLPAPPTVNALHQLPAPPADFTGRQDELKELLQAVKTGGVTISGLQGLGGVGKTALALKLAEQLKRDYPDAQFYLDLKGVTQPLTPRDAMAHVVRAYHPTAQLPEKEEELAPLYRSVLDGKRALLLMDNARDAQQVAPLIPPAGCLLLVTSRKHFTLPGLVEKNLDKLPPGDARDLLLRIALRLKKEKPEQVDELAHLCGYLPLALRAVGSALEVKKNISPADYANRLRETGRHLVLEEIDPSIQKSVGAVLQASYELLSDDLRQKLRFLAIFPDTFDYAAAAAVWEVTPDPVQDSLGELLAYSLVDFDETVKRYRLHDLVHIFVDQLLNAEERNAAQKHHAGYYLQVLRVADALYLKGGESVTHGLALFDAERNNILAGQGWAETQFNGDHIAAILCYSYPHAGANCLELRQHPRQRIRWLEVALDVSKLLKRREWEANALGNLGVAYYRLGDYRGAIGYFEGTLAIARTRGDRNGEGKALGNLGLSYRCLGECLRAIEYDEQQLQIAHETGDRRQESGALGNLGLVYHDMGEYSRAVEYHERDLQITVGIGDRRSQGDALGNLGSAYGAMGDYRRCIDYQEQHLRIARELGDRRGEGHALSNIGNACYGLGQYHTAIEYDDLSLQIACEIGDRSGEANALFNGALALHQLGDRAGAIVRAKAALSIYKTIESPTASIVRAKIVEWSGDNKAHGQGSAE